MSKGYPALEFLAEKLTLVLSKYFFADTVTAVYCINSWSANRFARTIALALNVALLRCDKNGLKRIKTFEEFQFFWQEIFSFAKDGYDADYIYPCFGEEKIAYEGVEYRLILGCGATQEYPSLYFLYGLAMATNRLDEMHGVLAYTNGVVNALVNENRISNPDSTVYEQPSESYWKTVSDFMDYIDAIFPPEHLCKIFSADKCPDEQLHFINYNDIFYPLFNPSFLIDYLELLLQEVEENGSDEVAKVVNGSLSSLSVGMFVPNNITKSGALPFACQLSNDNYKDIGISFALVHDNRIAIFLNEEQNDSFDTHSLKAAIKQGDFTLASKWDFGKKKRFAIVLRPDTQIVFVKYSNFISPNRMTIELGSFDEGVYHCSALDVATFLLAAQSVEELLDYLFETAAIPATKLFSFCGNGGRFISWQSSERIFLEGNEDSDGMYTLMLGHDVVDGFFYNVFTTCYAAFPSCGLPVLGHVLSWNSQKSARKGFWEIENKGYAPFFGSISRIGNAGSIFISRDFESCFKIPKEVLGLDNQVWRLVQDIVELIVIDKPNLFESILNGLHGYLELEFHPEEIWEEDGMPGFANDKKIAARFLCNSHPYIAFSVKRLEFIDAIQSVSDRSLEVDLFLTVFGTLNSILPNEIHALQNGLQELSKEKKKVSIYPKEIPYIFEGLTKLIFVHDYIWKQVGKNIANLCSEVSVKPGVYSRKSASGVIRKIQNVANHWLLEKIRSFDEQDLHVKLVRCCAEAEHVYFISKSRPIKATDIAESERDRIIATDSKQRDESLGVIAASRYLIELNLSETSHGQKRVSEKDMEELLAISSRLCSLSADADYLYMYGVGQTFVVNENLTFQLEECKELATRKKKLRERQLIDYGHPLLIDDLDIESLGRVLKGFELDTGFEFQLLSYVCDLLAMSFEDFDWMQKVTDNVVCCPVDVLKREILNELGTTDYSSDNIESCVDFLVLKRDFIKYDNGVAKSFVPIGRVKSRPNRYEMKPLVMFGNAVVFSRISVALAFKRWKDGLIQWFPPYKYGMENTIKAMEEWKSRYEKQLEVDVENIFIEAGLNRNHVFRGRDLKDYGNHPDLGDYDVLAFDSSTNILWLIECKEIEREGCAFDYAEFQNHYFGSENKKGKLSKFTERIQYVKGNLHSVLIDLGIPEVECRVESIVVSNKPFIDMSMNAPFEILTIGEFEKKLADSKPQS